MKLAITKIIALVVVTMFCSFFIDQELLAYGDDIETLFKSEVEKYNTTSSQFDERSSEIQKSGNTVTRTYYRYDTEVIGNTCSIYLEVRKKDTLHVTVNLESKEVQSRQTKEELSRELVNGLD